MFKFLKKSWEEATQIDKANIMTAVYLGGGAHISLYFIYKYFFGLYENLWLRILTIFLCTTVGFYYKLPEWIKKNIFPFYWHLMLITALPLVLSFNLLKNNFHEAWLYWNISMMFLLAIYVPNWLIYSIDLMIGVGGAFLLYFLTTPVLDFSPQFNIFAYTIVFLFSGIAGTFFIYGNKKTWLNKQKEQYSRMMSLTGSIIHEMRNPLNAINLCSNGINEVIKSSKKDKNEELLELNSDIVNAIKQAGEIIDIVLSDLSEKPVLQTEFEYLKPEEVLPRIVKKFGYKSESERIKIKLDLSFNSSSCSNSSTVSSSNLNDGRSSFIFRAVPQRFDFIIYNLMKNALYYLDQYPDSLVTIGLEERHRDGNDYNVIYVYDSGPGIEASIIPKIFGDFFTAGKKGGTGLGLAFCKRNMRLFGGEIFCESQLNIEESGVKKGGWTKFSLLFPKLSENQKQEARIQFENNRLERLAAEVMQSSNSLSASPNRINSKIIPKRILVVDDERTNLIVTKSKIEKYLPGVTCETALGGVKAVEMFEASHGSNSFYDLILMDIQMPGLDGVGATKKIRELSEKFLKKDINRKNLAESKEIELPIIAITSLDFKTFTNVVRQASCYFNAYINKSSGNNVLCRSVSKWLFDYGDDFIYLQECGHVQQILQNKEILLADDQEINRKITKKTLERYGMKVAESSNGEGLLNLYQASLIDNASIITSQTKISKFNVILTDINMPIMSGDEAAKKIREIEDANFTKYQNRIPIIALSGDSAKADIARFLQAQMTDYFVKGSDSDLLIKIIANCVKDDEGKKESICEDDEKNSQQNGSGVDFALNQQNQIQNQAQNSFQENSQTNSMAIQQSQEFLNLNTFNSEKISFFNAEEKKEIISLYLVDSSKIMDKIRQEYRDNNLLQISFNVHALKGISSNVGSERLIAFIRTVEPSLKHNQPPQNQNWFSDLELFYLQFANELKKNVG